MAVIRGTKDAKQSVVVGTKDSMNFPGVADTRKIRCKSCGGLAIQMPDGRGGMRLQCPGCGQVFKSTPLD